MSIIDLLKLIKSELENDKLPTTNIKTLEWIKTRYNKEITYAFGYEKAQGGNNTLYPLIYLAPSMDVETPGKITGTQQGSIIVQITEKDSTDGVFDGITASELIAKDIKSILKKNLIEGVLFTKFFTIYSRQHPFYEVEIAFNAIVDNRL
jgi:hypothetical protein